VAERQHAINVIESLQQSIVHCYGMCPVFCIGDIQDAFDSAFGSRLIKKVCFCRLIDIHKKI
jgi:hypothetical protein